MADPREVKNRHINTAVRKFIVARKREMPVRTSAQIARMVMQQLNVVIDAGYVLRALDSASGRAREDSRG